MIDLKICRMVIGLVLAILIAGCGGSSGGNSAAAIRPATDPALDAAVQPDSLPGEPGASCPDWFQNPPRDTKNFYATATEADRDLEAAFTRARQACLTRFEEEIVTNFRQLVAGVQFQRRLADDSELLAQFNQALRKAPDLALQEAAVTERQDLAEDDLWRVCLLMELRRRAVDQAVYDVVVADKELHAAAREGENFKVWEDYLQGKFDEE